MPQVTESKNVAPQLKHNKLRETLKRQIRDGRYAVGDRLPSEAELVKTMNVSRHTVLRGLSMLAAEGWVTREQGRGTFAARPDVATPSNTNTVALICSDHGDAFMSRLILGVSRALSANRQELLVLDSGHDARREAELLRELPSRGVGGALLWPIAPCENRGLIRDLEVRRFPLVLIDRGVEGVGLPLVSVDHECGAYEVTQHLIALGHVRIAHITSAIDRRNPSHAAIAREAGYRRAMEQAGLDVEPWMVERVDSGLMAKSHDPSFRSVLAYQQAHRLLARKVPPTAIFMLNDVFFQSVFVAASNHGLEVPGGLSLAGFNNDPDAWNQSVSLTTYDQPISVVSAEAIRILHEMIAGQDITDRERKISGELIARASTRPV